MKFESGEPKEDDGRKQTAYGIKAQTGNQGSTLGCLIFFGKCKFKGQQDRSNKNKNVVHKI